MASPRVSPLPRRVASSPRQLSIVMDGDEATPSTSRMTRSNVSKHNSDEELESSRSTIPFPSASNEESNDRPEDRGRGSFTAVIQALRSIVQTPPTSDDGHDQTLTPPTSPPHPASTPQLDTPLRAPKPSPSAFRSPSDDRIRRRSSPLKPSMSNVDSLASSRHDGTAKKVSFDHASSGPTVSMQNLSNVLQVTTHPPQSNSPGRGTPTRGYGARGTPIKGHSLGGTRSRSQSPRRFWPLSRMSSPGEPWEAKDPYRLHFKLDKLRRRRDTMLKCWDQGLRQLYRHFLLRLPSVYFTRVSKVFEEAELSRVEVQKMIDASKRARHRRLRRGQRQAQSESHAAHELDFWPNEQEWMTPIVSPSLQRFKQSWDDFMDSLQKEWKTLNVVSALLLSAILTMFQVDGSDQPVMRTGALIALICALWSLAFGCIYILRFSTMRSMHKASRWAEEAQKHTTGIWWNVWVFLALPSVFLAWSVISFCVAIMAFSWTTGSVTPPSPISDKAAIGPRLGITAVFLLGLFYFIRAVRTLKKYADPLPRHWALHSPPPISALDLGPGRNVSELDLERAEGIALGNVKAAADRAEAEDEAERERERGRGLIRGIRNFMW
ncbi:unnamed protein product [Rhizoctonia solani]|uniref:Transmembrane protein n=1 Tax=Rhizoctonia solani TaxID=456999 RepID=A0A8H2X964_9AGAM|nr:unnamed protein product [Rhizoctonia solani]CAE6421235.1 unnamed protein product [Rhizoctonia solani]